MTWPRWIEKIIADLFGYFWLPCPVCGQMFSGREISRMIDRGEKPGAYVESERQAKEGRSTLCCPDHQEDYYKDPDSGTIMQKVPRAIRQQIMEARRAEQPTLQEWGKKVAHIQQLRALARDVKLLNPEDQAHNDLSISLLMAIQATAEEFKMKRQADGIALEIEARRGSVS